MSWKRGRAIACIMGGLGWFTVGHAAPDPNAVNEDESKVPAYALPDPLLFADGTRVETIDQWNQKRRIEIQQLFAREVYGFSPPKPKEMSFRVLDTRSDALDGKAVRKVVQVDFAPTPGAPHMGILMYLPANAPGPVPIFVGMHLFDKAALVPEPGAPVVKEGLKLPEGIDPAMAPGKETIYRILERGYGIATINPEDIAPDDAKTYATKVVEMLRPPNQTERSPTEWGAIAVWGWGLQRALDYFETDPAIDAKKVIAIGHSRRGKAALWGAVNDYRFAAVISNNSGCGGAALSKRAFGETVALINRRFPHWFCLNFNKYNNKEDDLPVDQHMLVALMAPRPIYIASAEQDKWADPMGEFLSAYHAEPVYSLLKQAGLGVDRMPPINQSVGERIGYHCRSGEHKLSDFDWMLYLDWADRVVMGKKK